MIAVSNDDRVFVLTGAGISVESGLAAFRTVGGRGLWADTPVEDVCTPGAWQRDPWKVWDFYSKRREQAAIAPANLAHKALARLEERIGDRFFLCTQNIDNLHEKAGSTRLVHIHGQLFQSRCSKDCSPPIFDITIYKSLDEVSRCSCGAMLRPHVVFFEETPVHLDIVDEELRKATVMLVVGTSGVVHPAAGLVATARKAGVRTVYVGLEPPANQRHFSQIILGSASEILSGEMS